MSALKLEVEDQAPDLAAARLGAVLMLSSHDEDTARGHIRGVVRSIKGGRDVLPQGSVPLNSIIILEGWAATTRTLLDGRRQMQSILLPGDLYNFDLFSSSETDHALTSVGSLTYLELRCEQMRRLAEEFPRIGQALWKYDTRAAAMQREWIVNLGCRTAVERIAHLFCELHTRMKALGRVYHGQYAMPLTQGDIGDATGLTPVHVNRTLQHLRAAELIALQRHDLTIRDLPRLQRVAFYSPPPSDNGFQYSSQ